MRRSFRFRRFRRRFHRGRFRRRGRGARRGMRIPIGWRM